MRTIRPMVCLAGQRPQFSVKSRLWLNCANKNLVTMKYTSSSATKAHKCVRLSKTLLNTKKLTQLCSSVKRTVSTSSQSTIFSLSSGHGKCGVAVIRVSGLQSTEALKMIGRFKITPPPRTAVLRKLINPNTCEMIDRGIVLFFPGPNSFTGEDSVEFQIHGGPAVVSALLVALYQVPGCRQAEPGEFTKRAFLNGKLDLTEVEGLGDLIHAETEAQRRQALRQMEGDLGTLYRKWAELLTKCVAHIEAFIDFSEDQDIEEAVIHKVMERISELIREIAAHLDDSRRGERLRQGVQVVIIGEPNVGKSSLLNLLCQRSAAIVTPIAGTTRDVIETALNIGGYPVVLSDTAGLRQSADVVESEGIRRALERCRDADLKVFMLDSYTVREIITCTEKDSLPRYIWNSYEFLTCMGIKQEESNYNVSFNKKTYAVGDNEDQKFSKGHLWKFENKANFENTIFVLNKIDQLSDQELKDLNMRLGDTARHKLIVCPLSCLTKCGFSEFLMVLQKKVEILCGDPLMGHPSLTQERHRNHLNSCLQNLCRCKKLLEDHDIVLAAQCLRRGLRHIGSITGKVTSEDILDVIFRDFCIGK